MIVTVVAMFPLLRDKVRAAPVDEAREFSDTAWWAAP